MMRKLLSSTVLGGALVFAAMAGGYSDADANTFRDLSPNSSWAVSKIETANARPYCALARRFTNDIVLTFAKNKREEASIAIDFQKPRLSSQQYYNVKINAGNNQQRDFNIKPVSDRAIVLKVGADKAFMNALVGGGEMKADIEGHVYAFNISEFSDGENKMNGCLASLVEPAAGGAFDEPILPRNVSTNALTPSPVPVADTNDLLSAEPRDKDFVSKITENEAELARKVAQLQDENKRLRLALEKERRAFEDQYMAQSEDSSAVVELNEKVQLLEVENNELRRKLSGAVASQQQAKEMASASAAQCEADIKQDSAMARELELLRGEKETLQLQLKKAEARAADAIELDKATSVAETAMMQDLNDRISFLEQENRTLKAQLNEAADRQAAKAADSNADEQKIASMKDRIETLESQKEDLQSRLDEKSVVHNDTASLENLQQRVDRLLAENTRLSKTIESMKTDTATGTAADSFLVSKVKTLETNLQNVKRERNNLLEKIDAMNKSREDGLIEISSESWDLEKATRRYNEAEREIQRLGLELEQQRSRCNAEKKEIEYMLFDPAIAEREQIARLTEAEERAAKAETLLEGQKVRHDEQIAMLEDKTEALKQANMDLERAQTENIAARKLEQKNKQILASLQEKEAALLDARAAADSVKDKNRQLLLKLQEAEGALASAEALEREYEKAKADLQENKADHEAMAELEQKNKALLSKLDEAKNEIAALTSAQQQWNTAGHNLSDLEREKEFLMQKTAQLEKDNVLLSRDIREKEEKLAALQKDSAKGMSDIETASGGDTASAPRGSQKVTGELRVPEQQTGKEIQREPLPAENAKDDDAPLPLSPRSVNNYSDTLASLDKVQAQDGITSKISVKSSSSQKITGVSAYLQQAGIETDDGVKETEKGRNFAAYSWKTKGLYGSAEQHIMGKGQTFDDMVTGYLSSTEDRCDGDFASVMDKDETIADMRVSSYEIACIADDMSASASVVFIEKSGQFTTIAHEAGIDYMDYAMDMRDKLVKSLGPVKMASN